MNDRTHAEAISEAPHEPAPQRARSSAVALLLVNVLPLIGVLFFDWDTGAVVVLYWSENLLIGASNIAKMLTVAGLRAIPQSLFFLIHYGGFCAVHGLFIQILLLDLSPDLGALHWPFFLVFVELLVEVCAQMVAAAPSAWIVAFIGLAISHGYSFVMNFLLGGEYREATLRTLMAAPYRRIVALHVAIIVGGFAVMSLGQPTALLVALIVLKTAMDLGLHRQSHRRRPR